MTTMNETKHNPQHAEERSAAISAAWSAYRTESIRLSADRRMGWTDYLEADQRAWQRYLASERIAVGGKAA